MDQSAVHLEGPKMRAVFASANSRLIWTGSRTVLLPRTRLRLLLELSQAMIAPCLSSSLVQQIINFVFSTNRNNFKPSI